MNIYVDIALRMAGLKQFVKLTYNRPIMTALFPKFSDSVSYDIKNAESLLALKKIEEGKFDLVLSSPPYNVGKEYETKTSIENYLQGQEPIINELVRTLSDQGNLCRQVGNYVDRGEIYPLDIYYYQIFNKHGLMLRNIARH